MARRIGRYEVLAELGRGGFGQVFRCLDPSLGTPVAIKILTADDDAGMMVRFRNEAATSRRLRHPNIVTIYDFGEQDGIPYIVMELLEGEDLHRVIETHRPLSLLHKIGIMSQMASGLGHAHNEGVIHRDVKPANVMLLRDGTVKMMDFGIALITQSTHSRLTPRGAMIGTLRYMAPEQFRGAEPDARSDIFSYGLIFYELLSGVHPFYATDAAAQMYNILSVEPAPIRQFCPDCPPELQSILARLLCKDPDLRHQSLDDVLVDLEPALLKLRESRSLELVNEARLAKGQNQLEKAHGLIREALTLTPASEAARELREQLQGEIRRQAMRPRVADLVKRAREAMAAGNPNEAAQGFESAIRLDPSDTTLQGLLDEARAAAERLREVRQLLAEADGALANGDAAGAARIARRALELAPALARAREVLGQAEAALAEDNRKARFAEDSTHLWRLIEIHSWKEASELLAGLNRDFPDYSGVQILAEKLSIEQKREEDERKLAAGLAAARARFLDGDLSGTLAGLESLLVQFPHSTDVASMLSAVQLEIEAKRHRDLVARSVEEARRWVARDQFEAAVGVLDGALVQYPADPELQRERGAVVAASCEAAWRSAIQRAITQAGELRSQRRFADAVRLLDSFLSSGGGDPAIADLRSSIIAEQEAGRKDAELRDFIRRVSELIAKDELESATRLLEASPIHVRENSEVTRLRDAADLQKRLRAEKQTVLEALGLEVQPLCDQGRFDEALLGVDRFEKNYGADPGAVRLRDRIRSDQQKAQLSVEELRAQATALIASDPFQATVLLGGVPAHLRGRPEIRDLEPAARRAADEQRAREAVAELIARARSLYAERQFADALGLLETGLKSYPGQSDLTRFRADVLAAQAREQRGLFLRATIKIRELKSSHEFEDAERSLKEALADDSENPGLLQLLADVRARRQQWRAEQVEQEVRSGLLNFRDLLPTQPGLAVDLIESLRTKYPGRADIEAALGELREATAKTHRRQLLDEVERLSEQENFDAALVRLNALDPDVSGEAARSRDRVRMLKEQSQRRRAAEAIRAASAIREQDPGQALASLRALAESIRGRPEVQAAIQECQSAIEAADRRAALAEIEDLFVRGKLAKARKRHRDAVERFGSNAAFEAVLARMEAPARKAETRPIRPESSSQIPMILAGAFAVVAVVAGAWIFLHREPPQSPPKAVPISIEIRTDPDGVSVNIGDRSCVTPNCRFDLPPGSYQVLAQRAGYQPVQQPLNIEPGKNPDMMSLVLKPIEIPPPPGRPTGTLAVRTGMPDVLVFIDDRPAGRTNESGTLPPLSVEAAAHTIRVQKNGYDASPPERKVAVAANSSVPANFTLTQQPERLELSGAPAGVEVRAGDTIFHRSPESGVFTATAPFPFGTQILRITLGSDSREIKQTFEPGRPAILNWPDVAPVKTPPPPPPPPPPPVTTKDTCVPEHGDISTYHGEHTGTLQWVSLGQRATHVTIKGKTASPGSITSGASFPPWPVRIRLSGGATVVQEPSNCNERTLVFDRPPEVNEVTIQWDAK